MSHTRIRPFTGTTPVGVGATYVIVETRPSDTDIQVVANGTVTFTVDTTLQNITYDAAGMAAVNVRQPYDESRYVAPTDAIWTNLIASGSISARAQLTDNAVFAIRINITAGAAGSVTYAITQG
jgi:hypothetical protein